MVPTPLILLGSSPPCKLIPLLTVPSAFIAMKLTLPTLRWRAWVPASDPWSGLAVAGYDTIPVRDDLVIGPRPLFKAEKVLPFC